MKRRKSKVMHNTLRLIDQVRRTCPTRTDYAVAKTLELQQSHLTRILSGEIGLGPKQVVRIAELLRQDVRDILVLAEEDKATKPKDVEFWGRRSPRITATIAYAITALGVAVTSYNAERPGTGYPSSTGFPLYTLCEAIRKYLTFRKHGSFRYMAA